MTPRPHLVDTGRASAPGSRRQQPPGSSNPRTDQDPNTIRRREILHAGSPRQGAAGSDLVWISGPLRRTAPGTDAVWVRVSRIGYGSLALGTGHCVRDRDISLAQTTSGMPKRIDPTQNAQASHRTADFASHRTEGPSGLLPVRSPHVDECPVMDAPPSRPTPTPHSGEGTSADAVVLLDARTLHLGRR